MRTQIFTLLLIVMFLVCGLNATSHAAIIDSFEDGSINSSFWVTNGRFPGVQDGGNAWQYSFNEIPGSDGYLEARVWGPTSGNTYGAEASVRTVYDYNDGTPWLINFDWETTTGGYVPHFSAFAVQITDGGFNSNTANGYWLWNELPEGTQNLWLTVGEDDGSPSSELPPYPPFSKTSWSIVMDPSGTASFYQTPDASGAMISQISLDPAKEWYVRFVNLDVTSSGFDAGDNTIRLYNYTSTVVPEPTALFLLGSGLIGLIGLRRKIKLV